MKVNIQNIEIDNNHREGSKTIRVYVDNTDYLDSGDIFEAVAKYYKIKDYYDLMFRSTIFSFANLHQETRLSFILEDKYIEEWGIDSYSDNDINIEPKLYHY